MSGAGTEIKISEIRFSNRNENLIYGKINSCLKSLISALNKQLSERARKIDRFAEAVNEELAILKLGVDYKSFKLFDNISPHTYFTIGSDVPHVVDTEKGNYTKDNALFCYEFVLELALRLQSLDAWRS